MSAYRDEIVMQMRHLSRDDRTLFVGYNVRHGRCGGTLVDIADIQCIETPVAENLMVGIGLGLSLCGFLPVMFFERADFIYNAMDAIANHLARLKQISRNQYQPRAILRIVVGNSHKPLFTGPVHTQDTSDVLRAAVSFPVFCARTPEEISKAYADASDVKAIYEYKDLY